MHRFTPVLGKKYEELKAAGKNLEIVFVSSDSDAPSAAEYFKTMPFKMLDFADRKKKDELCSKYGVRGIPSLILVDGKSGKTLTTDGRSVLIGTPFDEIVKM
jgi:nucleoredoxin